MNIIQKVKALFAVKSAIDKVQEAKMKSGWKTTEFWMTVVTSVLTVFFAVQGMIDPKLTMQIVAAVTMLYTVARAVVKFTPTVKDDEVLAKIEAIYNSVKPK